MIDFDMFSKIVDEVYSAQETSYSKEDCMMVFEYFFRAYKYYRREDHPPLKREQIANLIVIMPYLDGRKSGVPDIDSFWYPDLIERYFTTEFKNCNYRINHFFSGKVRELRLQELLKEESREILEEEMMT